MLSSVTSATHVNSLTVFSDYEELVWTSPSQRGDGAHVLVDTSASMCEFRDEARLVLSALCCMSNLPRDKVVFPVPGGGTALLDVVNRVVGATKERCAVIVITDGCDTSSRATEVLRRVDALAEPTTVPLPGTRNRQQRDQAIATHIGLLNVDLFLMGIGNGVADFVTALRATTKNVRSGRVLPGATKEQIVALTRATFSREADPNRTEWSSDSIEPASSGDTDLVCDTAVRLAFGDSFTVDTAREAVDQGIRGALTGQSAISSDAHRTLRGLVAHVLCTGAVTHAPVPGSLVASKHAIVSVPPALRTLCNQTLSQLVRDRSVLVRMFKDSTKDGSEERFKCHQATHYTVSSRLSGDVARALEESPWCIPVASMPQSGRKRGLPQEP